MKSRVLIIVGIILAVIIVGIVSIQPDTDTKAGNYRYEIQGNAGGAGPHTKTDLLLTQINMDNPSSIHTVDLTKDLHYTDLVLFWDWHIHSFENYVFVSWMTSEQSWSDVFLAVSNDYGRTFDVKNISQNRNYISEYEIDHSEETVYVTWLHEFKTETNENINQIYFTKSDNFGESFGEKKILSTFDKSSYEFDLEAFGDNVIVVWRQDADLPDDDNIWLATSTDKAEYFQREAKLQGGNVDVDSYDGILHFAWVSVEDDNQIWYAYSENVGQTLNSRIIFDADWETNPYAQGPVPKITASDKIIIEWKMNNKEEERIPYKIIMESDFPDNLKPEPDPIPEEVADINIKKQNQYMSPFDEEWIHEFKEDYPTVITGKVIEWY